MSTTDNTNGPLSLDTPIDEDRVRRALGLKSSAPHQQRPEQARQRHRFVSDGAVPVVMLNRSDAETVGIRERLAAADAALENERQAHAATKRALHELQIVQHALQTRLQHNEMAHADALVGERDARRAAEETLASLRRDMLEAAVPSRRYVSPPRHEPDEAAPPEETIAPRPTRLIRKKRLAAPVREEKPVRWWTPSYRAKKVT